jgi:hypothetical protein
MKAVSERLFSSAIDCINSSDKEPDIGITAAGLPENSLSVKASTWNIGNLMV